MTKLPSVMWAPLLLLLLLLLLLPALSAADCTCDTDNLTPDSKTTTLNYKLAAVAAILTAGAVGVSLPLLGRSTLHVLRPENDIFFMVKAFAAGVILSTGFIHILPDAFDSLTSPCLGGADTVWRRFPFAGMTAMVAAIGSLMADSMATAYYRRVHFGKDKKAATAAAVAAEEEGEHEGHVHVHTHATHGHAHGAAVLVVEEEGVEHVREMGRLEVIRHRVTAQVLELGVVVHSVIIGISLGTAGSLDTIKPLMAALCFHQFFEGMGLGGCISQAKFESRAMATMALFFSVTTPVGVGIGIGISGVYNETSPTSLLIQGFFEAAAAGILIYMALVDLLASDFMSPRLQANLPLQLGANISLILGAGCMTVLAKWA